MAIHPTALIDPRAQIDPQAEIGPYVVIDGAVSVGRGTKVLAHATLTGNTEIGEDNEIHMGAVIGHTPQDLAYKGVTSFVKIGRRNIIREHSQIHRGTTEGSATVIGDDNYFMHNAHVAHNCRIGNQTIIAGGALLAGYVQVEDRAFVSGNCVVHQFCIMDGTHTVRGLNVVALRRAGFDHERIRALKEAFVRLFSRKVNVGRAAEELRARPCSADVLYLLDFIAQSKRGVCFGAGAFEENS